MCLGCGGISARAELQKRFLALNPDWSAQAGGVAPDGDVFIEDEQVLHFRVPSCEACGGILKPEVTFFGDSVSKATVQFVHDRLAESDAVLVVGSSLQVGLGETYEASCHLRHGSSGFLCFICFFFCLFPRCIQVTGFYWQQVTGRCQLPSWTSGPRGQTTWPSWKWAAAVVRCCQSFNLFDCHGHTI